MKRFISFLLFFCLMISLAGCGRTQKTEGEHIFFYYPRIEEQYEFGSTDGVISWEERDPAGHRNNLRYLLTLYLLGPVDEHLCSPFPEGCQITELTQDDMEATMTLSDHFASLKGMDLTLACVSLARTCFGLTDVQAVRILCRSADEQITIDETITRQQLLSEDMPLPTKSNK